MTLVYYCLKVSSIHHRFRLNILVKIYNLQNIWQNSEILDTDCIISTFEFYCDIVNWLPLIIVHLFFNAVFNIICISDISWQSVNYELLNKIAWNYIFVFWQVIISYFKTFVPRIVVFTHQVVQQVVNIQTIIGTVIVLWVADLYVFVKRNHRCKVIQDKISLCCDSINVCPHYEHWFFLPKILKWIEDSMHVLSCVIASVLWANWNHWTLENVSQTWQLP